MLDLMGGSKNKYQIRPYEGYALINGKTYASWAAFLSNSAVATFSRSSAKLVRTAAGVYSSVSTDVAAITDMGLSLEPASTNMVINSVLSGAGWVKASGAASGTLADVFGGTTGVTATESGASSFRAGPYTIVSGATYTHYQILKRSNCDWIRMTVGDSTTFTNGIRAWFNLTGTVGSTTVQGTGWAVVSSSMVALTGGYYLCSVTVTTSGTTIYCAVLTASANASTARADVGSGAGMGSAFIQCHAQLESGASWSSPIVTSGSTASRSADVFTFFPKADSYKEEAVFDDLTNQYSARSITSSGLAYPTNMKRTSLKDIVGYPI